MKVLGLMLIAVSLLSGCASMSPEECQTANWHQVGYQDGLNGHDPSIINNYTKDCADAGVTADHNEWKKGFAEGTKLFCSPEHGYQVGVDGQTYYGVCNSEQFVKNYRLGHQEYQRQQKLNQLNSEIAVVDSQIDSTPAGDKKNLRKLEEKRHGLTRERSELLKTNVNINLNF